MFDEIEKEYQKGLQERRFGAYYWPRATITVAVALLFIILLGASYWIVYLVAVAVLIFFVIKFFTKELVIASKKFPTVRQSKGILDKLKAYFAADDAMRINNLVLDLAKHNIDTKENLKLTLEFFQTRLPANSKPNILEWLLTTIITLSSVIIVTYDDEIGALNMQKLFSAFGSTIIAALALTTPLIIGTIITARISKTRNKVDTILVEDLAYIYVNFSEYHHKLTKITV